jgi:hypothetical protein
MVLITLFALKHYLADFVLQSRYMLAYKGIYGHWAGISHALIHIVLSYAVFALVGLYGGFIVLLCVAEFLVHYHMDWLKVRITKEHDLDITMRPYWLLFGFDQLVHVLTNIAQVWAVV